MKTINPKSLGRPRGYSNGQLTAPDARLLFIAGQVGWDEEQRLVSDDFVEQFERALRNLLAVARTGEIGERWRALMGRHFPAMTLVEVSALLEDGAKVEIEGIAVL
jgi:enamine deaminase RidA (YjgF/YER057c/UK114 family)